MKSLALPNQRHEQFAKLVALGMLLLHAYRQAGFKVPKSYKEQATARKEASRLASKPDIRGRIEQLRREAQERYQITTDTLIEDAMQCRDLGIELGQIGAAVQAVKEIGILTGLRVEKRETRRVAPEMISDEELAAIIRGASQALPEVGAGVGAGQMRTAHRPGLSTTYEVSMADTRSAKHREIVPVDAKKPNDPKD